eukprot:jgi/Psemu1/30948/gm1.30948_g
MPHFKQIWVGTQILVDFPIRKHFDAPYTGFEFVSRAFTTKLKMELTLKNGCAGQDPLLRQFPQTYLNFVSSNRP